MRRITKLSGVFAFVAAAVLATAQKTSDIQINVVDEKGKPVSGARVAQTWYLQNGKFEPASPTPYTTDSAGKATGKLTYYGKSVSLAAMDASGTKGGIVVADEAGLSKPLTIRLGPLRPVRIGTNVAGWTDAEPARVTISLMADGGGTLFAFGGGGTTTVMLPEGAYNVGTFSFETAQSEQTPFRVSSNTPPVVLNLEMSPIAKSVGKAPPALNVTEAAGLPNGFRLSDYKGRWVILDYWGYW